MNKFLTKVTSLCVGLAMVAGVGVAFGSKVSEARADSISSNFTDKDLNVGSGELSWTASIAAAGFETASPSRGVQFGAAKGVFTLTSETSLTNVTSIDFVLSTNGTANVNTIDAKVGGNAFGSQLTLPKENNSSQSITGSAASGVIELTVNDSNKSVYFKSISITYGGGDPTPAKELKNITIDVTGAKSEYVEDDAISTEGVVVTAHYDDDSSSNVTGSATIVANPSVASLGVDEIEYTATYEEKEAVGYKAISVSEKPAASGFALYSGDLVEGDYLVVYESGAMKASVASNRLQYTAVTISGDAIETSDETIIWHLAPEGDYWTLYNESTSKYAGSTGSKNQATLIASVTDNAKWTVTGSATYDFENLARSTGSDPNNKWLRKNGTYGFACYASGTGGSLSLYKSSESPTSTLSVTYNANGGTGTMTDSTEYSNGDTVTVKPNAFSAVDAFHEFVGFNTKADGSGVNYTSGNTFTISSNTTLYAQWAIKNVTLENGSYTSSISYVNPMPTELYVKDSGESNVGILEIQQDGLNYKTSYSEFDIAKDKSITIVNHSNATITKVLFEIYKFDNVNVYVDGSTEAIHTGDGTDKGDHYKIELTVDAATSVKIQGNGGSDGTKTQSFYGFEVFMRVGSEAIHPTGVSLNAESGNVYVGKTRQLTATVSPADADDKSVTWSSNNTGVATVDASTGLVTGVATGSATITATTVDGGLTASFVATVKPYSAGSLVEPLSVEEAREVLEISGATETTDTIYVKGVVSASYHNSSSKYLVWFQSSDGSVERYFEVYNPSLGSGVDSSYTTDNSLNGLEVIASGKAKIYSGTTYEISSSGVIESVKYTINAFAAAIISSTKATCDDYVDGESDYNTYQSTFESVWESLSTKYATLTQDEKDELAGIGGKEDGTAVQQAMARYDFLTSKYLLENFINGRTIPTFGSYIASRDLTADASSSVTIIVIIAVTSMTLLGVTLVLRKRKHQ